MYMMYIEIFEMKNYFSILAVIYHTKHHLIGLLVVLRIYVALVIFQPYRNLGAGDNQSLKSKRQNRKLNPGPLAPQAKSLTKHHCCSKKHNLKMNCAI